MKVNVILKSVICAISFYTANAGFGACEYDFNPYFDNTFSAKVKKKVFEANAPQNFNAEIKGGKIKIPRTISFDNYSMAFDVDQNRFEIENIEPKKNWKFVLVEEEGGFSLRVGEKKLFKKQTVNPQTKDEFERGLHHPTLAGFEFGAPKKVVAAGLIDKDKSGRIYFLIDSGNYGLDLEKAANDKVTSESRGKALVNLYHFFHDQNVSTHFEKMSIQLKKSDPVTSSVLVLGLN